MDIDQTGIRIFSLIIIQLGRVCEQIIRLQREDEVAEIDPLALGEDLHALRIHLRIVCDGRLYFVIRNDRYHRGAHANGGALGNAHCTGPCRHLGLVRSGNGHSTCGLDLGMICLSAVLFADGNSALSVADDHRDRRGNGHITILAADCTGQSLCRQFAAVIIVHVLGQVCGEGSIRAACHLAGHIHGRRIIVDAHRNTGCDGVAACSK